MTTRRPARHASPDCGRMAAVLWSYLDSELPAQAAGRVARHLADCRWCEQMATTLRALLEECRAAGCGPLPPDVRARARRRARAVLRPQ